MISNHCIYHMGTVPFIVLQGGYRHKKENIIGKQSSCPAVDSAPSWTHLGSENGLWLRQIIAYNLHRTDVSSFFMPKICYTLCSCSNTTHSLPFILDQGPSLGFSLLLSSGHNHLHKLSSSESCFYSIQLYHLLFQLCTGHIWGSGGLHSSKSNSYGVNCVTEDLT